MKTPEDNATMAVFLDLENIALGAREAKYPQFNIKRVLERLLLKGLIVVKKAYCDFSRYKEFKRDLHEASFELIEIPHLRQSGKNSADIRMVVDALDLCYTKNHMDTFVIISGDSDFSPLVSKLRENAKTVIGVGVKNSTSDLFLNNCDEFIYYDDLVRVQPRQRRAAAARSSNDNQRPARPDAPKKPSPGRGAPPTADKPQESQPEPTPDTTGTSEGPSLEKALDLVVETLDALAEERGADETIWASMLKPAIKRRSPGFNERAYGFSSFTGLLKEAEKRGMLKLEPDAKARTFMVRPVE